MDVIVSIFGMFSLIMVAYLLSHKRSNIRIHTVASSMLLQVLFGAFVLFSPFGVSMINGAADAVNSVINFGGEGVKFLLGDFYNSKQFGFMFAVNVLAITVFVSSLLSVLYHLNIMNLVVKYLGGSISKLLGTGKAESLSATANIFVGPVEAPMVIRPFIPIMSKSEIFAVMTGSLASVSGSTLVGYVQLGIEPKYILSAAFMTAPAGLLFAKIMYPESDPEAHKRYSVVLPSNTRASNIFEAAATGASQGLTQAIGIAASLVAFVGLIHLLDGMIMSIGSFVGLENLSLGYILKYAFAPFAWIMGVPESEMLKAAELIGKKLAINEFVAYTDFSVIKDTFSDKTKIIISFALCGFANFTSLAFIIGGLSTIAPERKSEISSLGLKALIAAFLANLMSGTIVGFLFSIKERSNGVSEFFASMKDFIT